MPHTNSRWLPCMRSSLMVALLLAIAALILAGCSAEDSASGPPDAKATDRALNPTPTPLPIADECPASGPVCGQAERVSGWLSTGDFQAILGEAAAIQRICSDPLPMVLEARCPGGATGEIVEGLTFVLAAKPVQFPPIAEFHADVRAEFEAPSTASWHVVAVACPGKDAAADCAHAFALLVSPESGEGALALVYTLDRAPQPQLIGAQSFATDAPGMNGGLIEIIYLDTETASTGAFWSMPWQPAA